MRDGAFFVKLVDGTAAYEILRRNPNAMLLLTLIALRAWKGRGVNLAGLEFGEAFIGDHADCGLSRREYRTAQAWLAARHLATFRTTNRGTIASLCSQAVYDIGRDPNDQQAASKRPPDDQQAATNRDKRLKNADFERGREGVSTVCDSSASEPSEVIEEGLSQELCARWRPAFDTLKATGKFPALRIEHLVNADRAHPGARMADAQTFNEIAADARGIAGAIRDATAWLRKRASGIEMRRLGIGRQALSGASRATRDRGKRDLAAGLPREWGGSVAGAVPAAKAQSAEAEKGGGS